MSGTSRGRPKQRHFNQLKTAERIPTVEDPTEEAEDCPADNASNPQTQEDDATAITENNEDNDGTLAQEHTIRRSKRSRQKTMHLQADGRQKVYTEAVAEEDSTSVSD